MESKDILKIKEYLINENYGIINDLIEIDSPLGLPYIYRFISIRNNILNNTNYINNQNYGYGYSFDYNAAMTKSIAEAIERYCSAFIKPDIITNFTNISNNENTILDPRNFISNIKRYREFNKDNKIARSFVNKVSNNSIAYCPSSLIYLPLPKTNLFPRFRREDSSGLAAGYSIEFSILNGLYEIIERDSFIIWWCTKSKYFIIPKSVLNIQVLKIIEEFQKFGIEIDFYDITSNLGVLTVLGVVTTDGRNNFPKIYIQVKAGFNLNEVINGLIGELIGGFYSLFEIFLANKKSKDIYKIKYYERNAYLYGYKYESISEFIKNRAINKDYKINNLYNSNISNISKRLEFLIDILENKNINVYYKNITTPDIRDLDLFVVRVLTCDLCYMESDFKNYNHKRLSKNVFVNRNIHPFS